MPATPASASQAFVLGRDPAADVLGAVDELGPRHLDPREKLHRGPIDQRDVPQIENNAARGRRREEFLEPRCMLLVEDTTQDEDVRAGLDRVVDPIGHVRALSRSPLRATRGPSPNTWFY